MEGSNNLHHDEPMDDNGAEESLSGSDDLGGGGVSDDEGEEGLQNRDRGYHRHNREQIQELEAFFKEFPHPDDRQREELSRRLGLGARQIKFWFQNRRTQLKTQLERHENILLKEDNNRLRNENDVLKIRLTNPTCSKCNGPAYSNVSIALSSEEQQLIRENARLKDELARLCVLPDKFTHNPINTSHLHSNCPSLNSDAKNSHDALKTGCRSISAGLSLGNGILMRPTVGVFEKKPYGKVGYIEAAISAMNELIKLAEAYAPIWTPTFAGSTDLLNHEEYLKLFFTGTRLGHSGVVREGTRDTAMVPLDSQAIVGILMDVDKWIEAFPCLIAKASTIEVIYSGPNGSNNGSLQLMKAEFHVLSPLVSTRQVRFIRFCKQRGKGLWVVVDVSVEEDAGSQEPTNCRKLPSGCILQDLSNNCTKVTWIEHSERDTGSIHPLFCHVINSGLPFGAPRWVASLQRHCYSSTSEMHLSGINPSGRKNILKLAQRMNELFCSGICTSTRSKWENIHVGDLSVDVKIKYRRSVSGPGESSGLRLCASTSFWMPATQDVLFNFLRNEHVRSQWDILLLGRAMQEIVRVSTGPGHNDCISLLRVTGMDSSQTGLMVLQESWMDATGALIIYAPVDASVIADAMNGRDTESLALLPSGFSIIPVGPTQGLVKGSGSLVTLGFQILVNTTTPIAKLTPVSFNTVHNLISFTVHRIKVALRLSQA